MAFGDDLPSHDPPQSSDVPQLPPATLWVECEPPSAYEQPVCSECACSCVCEWVNEWDGAQQSWAMANHTVLTGGWWTKDNHFSHCRSHLSVNILTQTNLFLLLHLTHRLDLACLGVLGETGADPRVCGRAVLVAYATHKPSYCGQTCRKRRNRDEGDKLKIPQGAEISPSFRRSWRNSPG